MTASALLVKSETSFRRALRHIGLSYFEQRTLFLDFNAELQRLLAFHYPQAWVEGERSCGFTPAERTSEQQMRLQQEIGKDLQAAYSLATFIEGQARAVKQGNIGKRAAWSHVSKRLDLWANRYNAVRAISQTVTCADKKLVWRFGQTEEHCSDCLRYVGRVYRASAWQRAGALPQSNSLECGGFRCDCRLEPTTARATPGYPPSPSGG